MFRVLKHLNNKWVPRTDDKNGVTLTEDEDIKRRWKEFGTKQNAAKDHQQTYNREREQDKPPRSEVEQALQQIRNGKSPGADYIPAGFWKASGEEGAELLW